MAIRVIDTVTGAGFTFPMLPESLEYSRFGRFEQLKLLDGDASLPTGETAGRISFSGKLPGSKRSGAYIESRRAPGEDGPPGRAQRATVLSAGYGGRGGSEQIAAMIGCGEVDMLLFFRDPVGAKPGEPNDVTLLRLCDMHTIPVATNIATAEVLIHGLERGDLAWIELQRGRK